MGVKFNGIFEGRSIKMQELSGKTIAIDAFNWIFQFLTTIRLADGSYLTDSKGRVTTHLNGIFYRCISMLENGINPVFVFDGKAPRFKKETLKERESIKEEARIKAENAVTQEERAMYMRRLSRIDDYIVASSKELLDYMGVKYVQAPAEGEAQAAWMSGKGLVYAAASQDYDTILFGAKRVIRNLNINNKRKISRKGITVQVNPEIIESDYNLKKLGVDREKMIVVALFTGTDYNKGVDGIGPRKALNLVKENSVEKLLESYDFRSDYDIKEVFQYFLTPDTVEVQNDLKLGSMQKEKLVEFMCKEHGFSEERMSASLQRIKREDSSLSFYD
ncbi:MAG: XPG I domain protein [Candidatus Parvarchaeum acidophilus ARMAN-5]|jgi:flap endonuclease-1|uniref:Flap endonuclease 1 n=1 Tax=Candidatus Parvarchaeum acidophilus ARMAN-5 TaxID=662762 RepID=D6GUG2_PARA5|nr:MAG: XPG I domain protein [Candidatus Parvarchaeum acidophilus ARMAN-5]